MPEIHPQDVVDLLNELLEINPEAIDDFVSRRVPVGEEIAEHQSVVLRADPDGDGYKNPRLGVIGFLNGLFTETEDRIAAIIDKETETAKEFRLIDFSQRPPD